MEGNLGQYCDFWKPPPPHGAFRQRRAGHGFGVDPWGQGAGRQEAGEIRMFNHWATGLRSGLLPQVVVLQHQKLAKKRDSFGRSFRKGFDFWCQGKVFWRVLVGSRRSPACFLQGLAPPMVRWEVSYEGKSFQKKLEI